jgi:GNAT superfamily N-acetyltransferase
MDILRATETHLPAAMGMAASFFEASGLARLGAFDESAMSEMLKGCIADQFRALFVAIDAGKAVGMIGMALVPLFAAPTIVFAQELFWWVEPEARRSGVGRKLIAAGEAWARENDATLFSMVALANDPGAADQMYARSGFEKLETTWARRL